MKVADVNSQHALATINPIWAPPEILTGEEYTLKADIYALGIVLWEILAQDAPFASIALENLRGYVVSGNRPVILDVFLDDPISRAYVNIVQSCWDASPQLRPSVRQVYQKLVRISELCESPLSRCLPVLSDIVPPRPPSQVVIESLRGCPLSAPPSLDETTPLSNLGSSRMRSSSNQPIPLPNALSKISSIQPISRRSSRSLIEISRSISPFRSYRLECVSCHGKFTANAQKPSLCPTCNKILCPSCIDSCCPASDSSAQSQYRV